MTSFNQLYCLSLSAYCTSVLGSRSNARNACGKNEPKQSLVSDNYAKLKEPHD